MKTEACRSRDELANVGSVLLVEKKGPFGLFSKFPDDKQSLAELKLSLWDVFYYGGVLNNVNTKEELTKFPDKVAKE